MSLNYITIFQVPIVRHQFKSKFNDSVSVLFLSFNRILNGNDSVNIINVQQKKKINVILFAACRNNANLLSKSNRINVKWTPVYNMNEKKTQFFSFFLLFYRVNITSIANEMHIKNSEYMCIVLCIARQRRRSSCHMLWLRWRKRNKKNKNGQNNEKKTNYIRNIRQEYFFSLLSILYI